MSSKYYHELWETFIVLTTITMVDWRRVWLYIQGIQVTEAVSSVCYRFILEIFLNKCDKTVENTKTHWQAVQWPRQFMFTSLCTALALLWFGCVYHVVANHSLDSFRPTWWGKESRWSNSHHAYKVFLVAVLFVSGVNTLDAMTWRTLSSDISLNAAVTFLHDVFF